MWKYTTNAVLVALSLVACTLADNCAVSIVPTKLSQWSTSTLNGSTGYSMWNVVITAPPSANILSLELHLPSHPKVIQVLQMVSERPEYYTLPTSSLSSGHTHSFSYIVESIRGTNISVSNITCAPQSAPTTNPPTSTSVPTRSPDYDKVCDVVLVIDNFIVRTHPNLDSVRDKYTSYFADVDLFYQKHFKTKMNLIHMHLEDGPTFSGTNDEGELLDSFRSALVGGFFGTDIPIGACTYHLMTGRDPVGIGGLSWIDTLCSASFYNSGFSVDLQSQDPPVEVLRRVIHELGHGFGGQHFDYYSNNPLYKCDAGESRASDRILRSVQASVYTYLNDEYFFSQCATNTIASSAPSFPCLWGTANYTSLPAVTLYEGKDFKSTSTVVRAHNGISSWCYNIVYPYGGITSAFTLEGEGLTGIRFFEFQDCIGQVYEFPNTTSLAYVGDTANHKANSFQFIL